MADAAKPNNKIVNPYCQYITDTLSGYMCGKPITYNSNEEAQLEELNLILKYNDAGAEDMELTKDASIYGVAYELLYIDNDGMIRFTKLNPKDITIVYDDTVEKNILYGIRKIPVYNIINDTTTYRIEVYSKVDIKIYETDSNMNVISLVEEIPHFFNDVPIVEYKNNEREIGDFETIIPLIDAYDTLQSDSLNDYSYFVDAYLMLTGVTAETEDIAQMKENRVLLLDEDAKAEWLIKNSNDNPTENYKSRLQNDIHKFAKVPDLSDESFSSNASGIAIKFKLYGTETLVSNKERYFTKGLQRRIELIFNILNLKNSGYDWRSIEITFTRNIPTNTSEIADVVSKLAGLVSNETLLAQIPFVTDVAAEVERLETNKPFYDLNTELEEDIYAEND